MTALPLGEDWRFLHVKGGKVHVIAFVQPDRDVIGFLLGDTLTLCGRMISKHQGGLDAHAEPVGEFADGDLCALCYHAVRLEDRGTLFEHDEPKMGGVRLVLSILDECADLPD